MNSFGRIFRVSIFGESHGEAVGVIIDGCPAGLELHAGDFAGDLNRRKGGKPGTTRRREDDVPRFISGIFEGRTTGAPLTVIFENSDTRSADYEDLRHKPRPGHADFALHAKHGGFADYRGGGHSSGRLSACLVAAGVVAEKLIPEIEIRAELTEAGGNRDIESEVEKALGRGDSIGAKISCRAANIPPGLGEPFFDSVESALSHALFSVPGVKAVEFGDGVRSASMSGSEYNDEIVNARGKTATNHSGGINGGITNGNDILFHIYVRPTASISIPQKTVDLKSGEKAEISIGGRHDACIALRMPVIIEAVTAITLADFSLLRRSGKDIHKAQL